MHHLIIQTVRKKDDVVVESEVEEFRSIYNLNNRKSRIELDPPPTDPLHYIRTLTKQRATSQ